jgi:lipoprotein-anchoring transpeptidase ErfK/SrfK
VQVLGSRRGGVITLAVAAVALLVAAAFAVWQLVERPSVTAPVPAPDSAVASPLPAIAFEVPSETRLGGLRVLVDGRDATSSVRNVGGRLTLTPPAALRDGGHWVDVRFHSRNVFARTVSRRWDFAVDTTAPKLAVASPPRGGLLPRRAVRFAGTGEAGSRVTVAFAGGTAVATTGPDGTWQTIARLPEGRVAATITGADRAGNTIARRRRVTVDTTAPSLALTDPAPGRRLTETDQPLVYGSVTSDSPRNLTFSASVNGTPVATVKGSAATSPADVETSYGQAAAGTTSALEVDGRRFAMAVGTLAQGRNRIAISVRDRAGNVARTTTVVSVDSTEEFGPVDLGAGAKGADVVALQQRLREAKVYPKKARLGGVLNATTVAAVSRYQKRYDLPITGVVDGRTRGAMIGRIVVNIGQRKLRLIRNGRVWKTYSIAVGQPAYPTPTGQYEINDKQVDPIWYPPDSPWAAELSSIPAGPGNPLGTRWIGTTAPAIGIHGTYADYSIGTAASHGCMRMHIPEVEALFDQVAIGMKVSIRA